VGPATASVAVHDPRRLTHGGLRVHRAPEAPMLMVPRL
jgi:hypothetical protein